MNIKAFFDPPPIPFRGNDWVAIDMDNTDGAPDAHPSARCVGYGATEQDAIDDLQEQLAELES